MKLTSESKILFGILAATVAIIAIAVVALPKGSSGPTVSREELIIQGTATRGNLNAQVFLVEFSDFQCPACRAFAPIVDELVATYPDKLLFAYRHYPLDQHTYALPAALAAEAAGKQGKFWEMSQLLFINQDKFSDTLWTELAKQLNLDGKAFEEAMSSREIEEKILADKAQALQLGLASTPTFFLNGTKLTLYSTEDLTKAVEKAVQ